MLKSNTLNNKIPARIRHGLAHRVGRVLRFFSSRRNWDSPNPLPASECGPPPALGGGAHSLAERGVGRVPIPTRGHTLWYSLYLHTLWSSPMKIQCICCCTIPSAILKFEDFIGEAFPFQRHLPRLWCINVSLRAKGRRAGKLCGPLLLFDYSKSWPFLSSFLGQKHTFGN